MRPETVSLVLLYAVVAMALEGLGSFRPHGLSAQDAMKRNGHIDLQEPWKHAAGTIEHSLKTTNCGDISCPDK
jgi:hypothetical protein